MLLAFVVTAADNTIYATHGRMHRVTTDDATDATAARPHGDPPTDHTDHAGATDDPDAIFAAFLRDRDTRCPRCGYALRGLTTPRCPECGDRLTLEVALVEPRLGAFITTLVACSLGFGGSTLFLSLALREAPRSWWTGACAILLETQLLLTLAALAALLLLRRRVRRLTPARQWAIAVAASLIVIGLSIASVVTFDS